MSKICRILAVAALALVSAACVVSESRPVEYTPAERAQTEVADSHRLNIGIAVLDPGLPEEGSRAASKENVSPAVREAEGHFIAYHLKDTLERTSHWGAVRVVPGGRPGTELMVTGTILRSDGLELEIDVVAEDATGRVWLDRKFEGRADSGTYSDGEIMGRDPFQNVYNDIANALLSERARLQTDDLVNIRRVAELRFAESLAPSVFDGLLDEERGRYRVVRLPADNDPMVERMRSVRDRDQLFVDTLNEHYAGFYRQMETPYDDWRKYSYDEAIALKELQAAARWRKLVGAAAVVGAIVADANSESRAGDAASNVMLIGGIELFRQGLQVGKEAKMQEEVLAELSTSFGQEIEPATVTVAGETRRLEGSAATQYAEWRRLMREIYQAETGFDLPDDDPSNLEWTVRDEDEHGETTTVPAAGDVEAEPGPASAAGDGAAPKTTQTADLAAGESPAPQ
jgi:hypothetical protein